MFADSPPPPPHTHPAGRGQKGFNTKQNVWIYFLLRVHTSKSITQEKKGRPPRAVLPRKINTLTRQGNEGLDRARTALRPCPGALTAPFFLHSRSPVLSSWPPSWFSWHLGRHICQYPGSSPSTGHAVPKSAAPELPVAWNCSALRQGAHEPEPAGR